MRYRVVGCPHRRLTRLRADRRVMLPLGRFQGCRLVSQVPGPATPHAPNTSPIATFRTGSAVVALRAGSSWKINGSMGQAAKLEWSRIWKGTCVQAGSFSPPILPRAVHPSSEFTMASQTRSRSRSTSIRSIGCPPLFTSTFSVEPSASRSFHHILSSLYLILRHHTPYGSLLAPSVPGWTLELYLIPEYKASLCWKSIITI